MRAEETLRAAGERGDIIRTMRRAMGVRARPVEIFDSTSSGIDVVCRIVSKGLSDELSDRR
jgi:hypothetical protein